MLVGVQGLAQRVERARPDVAVHDTERPKGQDGEAVAGGVFWVRHVRNIASP